MSFYTGEDVPPHLVYALLSTQCALSGVSSCWKFTILQSQAPHLPYVPYMGNVAFTSLENLPCSVLYIQVLNYILL